MNQEIVIEDKLVQLCVLETNIHKVETENQRDTVCKKMCDFAKDDGITIINQTNPHLCNPCSEYNK